MLLLLLQATRPAFIGVSVIACALGIANAHHTGLAVQGSLAFGTMLAAALAHAGANVLNDYYDALNGTDAANEARVSPFTGGSRMIQNGALGLNATRHLAYSLFLPVVPLGMFISWQVGPGLLWIGAAGLAIGWAYSARPLQLMSRGLGEIGIVLAWCLMVVGADFVQRGAFNAQAGQLGLMWGLSVASILCINQFPDLQADALAGKRTLVVRLGPKLAVGVYVLLLATSYGLFGYLAASHHWSVHSALVLLPMVMSGAAAYDLFRYAHHPQHLRRAIVQTILANHLLGGVVVICLRVMA